MLNEQTVLYSLNINENEEVTQYKHTNYANDIPLTFNVLKETDKVFNSIIDLEEYYLSIEVEHDKSKKYSFNKRDRSYLIMYYVSKAFEN